MAEDVSAGSQPAYWLDLFTHKSWNEFLAAGGAVSGFSAGRWTTVQKMNVGDLLLCYLTGISRFVGVLQVVGEPFTDKTVIYSDAEFPSRVPVRVVHALTAETAVPVLDLRNDLSVFQNLSNPNFWSGAFRGSPARWKADDGETVVRFVAEAQANPIERAVDKGKLAHRPRAFRTALGEVTVPEDEEMAGTLLPETEPLATGAEATTSHTEIQGLLLQIGSAMGLDVWVARNDPNRIWRGKTFSEQFKLRSELPHNFDSATSKIIEMIDVLWLEGNAIRAAFEIESTTSIYSGLLRMSDLVAMQPNLQIPLFIVAPEERRSKVINEVNRPTFAALKQPLVKVCRFLGFDALRSYAKEAGQWSKFMKPDVLQELSESCDPAEA